MRKAVMLPSTTHEHPILRFEGLVVELIPPLISKLKFRHRASPFSEFGRSVPSSWTSKHSVILSDSLGRESGHR